MSDSDSGESFTIVEFPQDVRPEDVFQDYEIPCTGEINGSAGECTQELRLLAVVLDELKNQ